jgi:ketosteroid isomerase-like protein
MRGVLLSCILLAFGSGSIGAAAQRQSAQSDQELLIQLEKDWDAAFFRKDVPFIEHILADEFIAAYADGMTGTKAVELAGVRDFNQQVDSSTLDEFAVKIYGDTATVRFLRHMVGPLNGQRHEVTYRFLDVFVYRDGRWQCVASSSVKIQV